MILSNKKKWDKWAIKEDAHKFFLIRWNEIFSEDTFDSWQVRTSNIRSILHEILDLLEVVERVHESHPNIKFLIEEAYFVTKNDIILKKYFLFIPNYLKKLEELYEKNIKNVKNFEKRNIANFRSFLKVIIGNLESYRKKLCEEILEILRNPPKKFKKDLYSLTMALGIELKISGYSLNSLRNSFEILTDPTEKKFWKRFEKLIEKFNGKKYTFYCFFYIIWPIPFPDLSGQDIELILNVPTEVFTDEEKKFYNQDKQAIIAKIRVEAQDEYSARYISEEKLETLFAVRRLYQITKQTKIKHQLALVERNDKFLTCIPYDTTRLGYIRDVTQVEKSIISFTELFSRLDTKSLHQITAALQYHKLALSAASDEARLVNLWTALESLLLDGDRAIIRTICNYIPKINSTGYLYLVLKALAIDIKDLWRSSDTSKILPLLNNSTKYILEPLDLLDILLDEETGERLSEFRKLIGDQLFLIFRIYRIYENLLGGPNLHRQCLENHKKNIEWQILRIYRARNFVIHRGVSPPGTRHLIQHLHSYFIIAIHKLLYDLERNECWNIGDALEHRKEIYDIFLTKLKNYDSQPISKEELLDPEKCLSCKTDEPAWTESRNKDKN